MAQSDETVLRAVKGLIADEAAAYDLVKELRGSDIVALQGAVQVTSKEEAISRGIEVIQNMMDAFFGAGVTFDKTDPGHGLGHIGRDYVSAVRLARALDLPPQAIFAGMVAGVFHDIGCMVVNRYHDSETPIRHAEVAAFMIDALAIRSANAFGMSADEQRLVMYGVAAHTHYLAPSMVKGKDGKSYELLPYADLDADEKPVYSVWLPRWVDRLDVNGPTFPARHYLTLIKPHKDYSAEGFYPTDLSFGMMPFLRSADVIRAEGKGRTMLEHLEMFRTSQTNASPYGKWDTGAMVEIRDGLALQLGRIIGAVRPDPTLSAAREAQLRRAWAAFLATTIEPHPEVGAPAAAALDKAFGELPHLYRTAWVRGFEQIMLEYLLWSERVIAEVDAWPVRARRFGPMADVRDFLKPASVWTSLL